MKSQLNNTDLDPVKSPKLKVKKKRGQPRGLFFPELVEKYNSVKKKVINFKDKKREETKTIVLSFKILVLFPNTRLFYCTSQVWYMESGSESSIRI